jgi:hypothetical protein
MKKHVEHNFRYLVTTLSITCIESGAGFNSSFLCDSLEEVKEYLKKNEDYEAVIDVYDLITGKKLNL